MLEIDGSYLEGGGQILRTAVALSAVTGKACKIVNIRAKRKNAGIQAQHLQAINAVMQLCDADVIGNEMGSTTLTFSPKKLSHVDLEINIPTAGSVALVLQSIMIATSNSDKKINIEFKGGGTYGKWAPTIGYLGNVFLPMIKKWGYRASIFVEKHGFYPKGGAAVQCEIKPSQIGVKEIMDRGDLEFVRTGVIATKDLENKQVLDRAKRTITNILQREMHVTPEIGTEYVDADSTGFAVDLYGQYQNTILGYNGLGDIGKPVEKVIEGVIDSFLKMHGRNAALDSNLADQLIPYMGLAGGGSIKTAEITDHCKTNIWITEQFLPVKFTVDKNVVMCKSL